MIRRRQRRRLYLLPDYGPEAYAPVSSDRGRLTFAQLRISQALRNALADWQAEACDDEGTYPRSGRGVEEWRQDGERLARWLSDETGLQVDFET